MPRRNSNTSSESHALGAHEFENWLRTTEVADPENLDLVDLADLAGELHVDEAELGFFCWQHVSAEDFDPYTSKLTPQGVELVRTWLGKD